MGLNIIILAAGQGTRMKSDLPKVLQPLAGRPLLAHVVDTALRLSPEKIHVVHGYGGAQVQACFHDHDLAPDLIWVEQAEQLGTGHAVQLALAEIGDEDDILVLYGDVPFISLDTLQAFLAETGGLGVLTAMLKDPAGYGRILRDPQGRITGIVEQRDASKAENRIDEINTGIMAGKAGLLKRLLGQVDSGNDQGEIYLTDVVALANREAVRIDNLQVTSELEISGINDKKQLAGMERTKQAMIADELMQQGVSLYDPARLDVRGELVCGKDVTIDVNCIVEGRVELKDGVQVGPNVCLRDCTIGKGATIKANSMIEEAIVGDNAIVGPFARLRPGTQLSNEVHIGNFVEIKNSVIESQSKINHLSYVGDSEVGRRVNIGAGTITCNYDGANKHKTRIADDAFIGSGTELVAPLSVGEGATVGAGSTLTKDVPANELTVERGQQKSISGWKRPTKKTADNPSDK